MNGLKKENLQLETDVSKPKNYRSTLVFIVSGCVHLFYVSYSILLKLFIHSPLNFPLSLIGYICGQFHVVFAQTVFVLPKICEQKGQKVVEVQRRSSLDKLHSKGE